MNFRFVFGGLGAPGIRVNCGHTQVNHGHVSSAPGVVPGEEGLCSETSVVFPGLAGLKQRFSQCTSNLGF